MKRIDTLTKSLAIVGTALVAIPILAPLVFSTIRFAQSGRLMLDWLMPAELFPFVLIGGAMLLLAAFRAHSHRDAIGIGLGVAFALLAGAQIFAEVSGLASGRTEPEGLAMVLVTAMIGLYAAAIVEMDVAGGLLIRDTFRKTAPE
ncbi:MAG: hypothetical protein CVT66_06710 [Actinobacteria bacterium HGW-Actinobacteria-6]|nr:MAG: hypothetical protein CVT66_06710 [Actinobacteria bacterium HGW-Actinobacteria-6]